MMGLEYSRVLEKGQGTTFHQTREYPTNTLSATSGRLITMFSGVLVVNQTRSSVVLFEPSDRTRGRPVGFCGRLSCSGAQAIGSVRSRVEPHSFERDIERDQVPQELAITIKIPHLCTVDAPSSIHPLCGGGAAWCDRRFTAGRGIASCARSRTRAGKAIGGSVRRIAPCQPSLIRARQDMAKSTA